MAFTDSVFGSVSLNDAEVAIQYWVEILAKDMGDSWLGSSKVFLSSKSLLDVARQNRYDLVSVPPVDYLRASSSLDLEPILVSTLNGKHMARFTLLVKKDGPDSLEALKGKTIALQSYGCGDAHELWLDVELAKRGLPQTNRFFQKIIQGKEAAKMVLPVFFGKLDACVVLDGSFEVICEMNPQLKRDLKVLVQSDEVLGGVVLFPRSMSEERRNSLKRICLKMSTYPRGKQILTLFRIDNLLEFPAGALSSLQSLLAEHQKRFPVP